jgi:hypothetical protein
VRKGLPGCRCVLQAHIPWLGKLRVIGTYGTDHDAALARDLAWIALRGAGYQLTTLNLPSHPEVRRAIAVAIEGQSPRSVGSRESTASIVTWESIQSKTTPWLEDRADSPRVLRGVTEWPARTTNRWEVRRSLSRLKLRNDSSDLPMYAFLRACASVVVPNPTCTIHHFAGAPPNRQRTPSHWFFRYGARGWAAARSALHSRG